MKTIKINAATAGIFVLLLSFTACKKEKSDVDSKSASRKWQINGCL
ncbi:hypothetical protein [Pedobacter heparinus]|nr:hypothetical protein [Pedobacter heparinus]